MTSAAKGPALPFRGEFGEPLNVEALAVENAAGNGAPLLSAVLRDPHLLELDRDIRFADVLQSARQGTLDSDEFLMRGRLAIAAYRRRCGRASHGRSHQTPTWPCSSSRSSSLLPIPCCGFPRAGRRVHCRHRAIC